MDRASSRRERPWAVVEITARSDEQKRTELIRAAYRSSVSGVVALALRGVPRHAVDRALDTVVDLRHDRVRGVVYIDADSSENEVLAVARSAQFVLAESEDLRDELLLHGIVAVHAENGAHLVMNFRHGRPGQQSARSE